MDSLSSDLRKVFGRDWLNGLIAWGSIHSAYRFYNYDQIWCKKFSIHKLTRANRKICRWSSSKGRCRFRNTIANEKYDEIQLLISAIEKEIDSFGDSAGNSSESSDSSDERRYLINASRNDSSEDSSIEQQKVKGSLQATEGEIARDRDMQDQTSYSFSKYKYGKRSLRSSKHSIELLEHDNGMEQRSSPQERAYFALVIGSTFVVATVMLQLIKYVKK